MGEEAFKLDIPVAWALVKRQRFDLAQYLQRPGFDKIGVFDKRGKAIKGQKC